MRTYSGKITSLGSNEIFVFGSNTQGRHGKGAAYTAYKQFGAILGQPIGLQGQTYAIVTKDLTKKAHPSISKEIVSFQIKILYEFASNRAFCDFYVAYSGTGTNLNGYSPREMAQMFSMYPIPGNMVFEEEFAKLLKT